MEQFEARESEGNKIVVESINEAYLKINEGARKILNERFGSEGQDPMEYHVREHSENVAKNARRVLEIVKEIDPGLVSDFDLDFVASESLYHDIVQASLRPKGQPRKRLRGFEGFEDENLGKAARASGHTIGNERNSAEELLKELEKYVYHNNGAGVFQTESGGFRQEVLMDIAATYPDFMMADLPDGTKGLKISQRYLTPDSSLRAFAIASADLRGDVGTGSDYGKFRNSGNAELRETQDQIKEKLTKGIQNLTSEEMSEMAKTVINFKKAQRGFALWQKILWNESLATNKIINGSAKAEEIKSRLKQFIKDENFEANASAAKKESEELEKKYGAINGAGDLAKLLKRVGYKIE